jgi:hypothetical protein
MNNPSAVGRGSACGVPRWGRFSEDDLGAEDFRPNTTLGQPVRRLASFWLCSVVWTGCSSAYRAVQEKTGARAPCWAGQAAAKAAAGVSYGIEDDAAGVQLSNLDANSVERCQSECERVDA